MGWPDISWNKNDKIFDEDREDFNTLLGAKVPHQAELLIEQNLYDVGLSLINSLVII